MAPSPEQKNSEESGNASSDRRIQRLFYYLRKMPGLSSLAPSNAKGPESLSDCVENIRNSASAVVAKFKEQKKIILQQFDDLMKPIAREVLDGFLQDAKQLKHNLESTLQSLDQKTAEEWEEEANRWMQLYSRWNDPKSLIEKILEVVSARTRHLIDKDIRVIHEYQTQSLAQLPKESEVFKNLEMRLAHAIEEPLKHMMGLRNKPKEHTSLQQAADWVANLQDRREDYFNQLLMKIDHVMKDVVSLEEADDLTAFREVEDEIVFMERELDHIKADLIHLESFDEADKQFLLGRLEGALEHVEDLASHPLPHSLRARMQSLKIEIMDSIKLVQG